MLYWSSQRILLVLCDGTVKSIDVIDCLDFEVRMDFEVSKFKVDRRIVL